MEDLEAIAGKIVGSLEAKNVIRERALTMSRQVIQRGARSIQAIHRGEYEVAKELLSEASGIIAAMREEAASHPDIYFAGYVQDAQKEFAEASVTYALISGQPLPDPDDLGVEYAAYLNGLGEAMGELRRYILDLIRRGQLERGEELLKIMEDIYGLLVAIDFPQAITGGLRRTTDMVRGVVERTRGDLTMAIRQEKLREALEELEDRVLKEPEGVDDEPLLSRGEYP